ncbi:MAG: OmpA family protein [Kofleriaceae bacterium]
MRSKLIFLAPLAFAGCYKATGPEVCTPVVTSWGSPVYHCAATPMAVPEMPAPVVEAPVEAPPPPPPPKTEVTQDEIKLKEKVEFETDSAKLLPASTPLLDEVASVMKDHPEIEHVRVGGHTDSTGNAAHNLKLSEGRAASVKQYLVDHGVAAERLASKGYGQTRPVGDNKTDEGRAQNRRVEIHILRHKGEQKDREDK